MGLIESILYHQGMTPGWGTLLPRRNGLDPQDMLALQLKDMEAEKARRAQRRSLLELPRSERSRHSGSGAFEQPAPRCCGAEHARITPAPAVQPAAQPRDPLSVRTTTGGGVDEAREPPTAREDAGP